jgi:hypothetical protein
MNGWAKQAQRAGDVRSMEGHARREWLQELGIAMAAFTPPAIGQDVAADDRCRLAAVPEANRDSAFQINGLGAPRGGPLRSGQEPVRGACPAASLVGLTGLRTSQACAD